MTKRKKIVLGASAVVVVATLAIVNLTMSDDKATEVQIEKAPRRTLVETVSANGRIQPQIDRFIDCTHAALAELPHDAITILQFGSRNKLRPVCAGAIRLRGTGHGE